MKERLAFNVGTRERETPRARKPSASALDAPPRPTTARAARSMVRGGPAGRARAEASPSSERDWAWLGLLGFTAVLFLRPQDQVPALEMLHLAELFALLGLGAMVLVRTSRGLPAAPFTPEIGGLLAFGAAMLVGIPFSFWPGGAAKDFVEIYVKVVAIVVLMIHSLDRVERLERFTWLIVLCSGYVAATSTVNYARGVNVWEGNRLAGAVGGIFGNPNDLALNMVVFMPFALAAAFKPGPALWRAVAALGALVMTAAIILTKSRGGFVGLAAMMLALVISSMRVRPAIGVAAVVAVLAVAPLATGSFWDRMVSILDEEHDTTGSRQARLDLMKEGVRVFADHPVFGIGLGQFVNYDPTGRKEAWNVTHNATLQVAAELGILGLVPFFYLIARAARAVRTTRRILLPPAARATASGRAHAVPGADDGPVRPTLLTIATALGPALVGWLVCAQFASVALNWTFYFVLGTIVATREVALQSATGLRQSTRPKVLQ